MDTMTIHLKDNHFGTIRCRNGNVYHRGKLYSKAENKQGYFEHKYADIDSEEPPTNAKIASVDFSTLKEICEQSSVASMRKSNVLVFGSSDNNDFEEQKLFWMTDIVANKSFRLETGNLMGVVRFYPSDSRDKKSKCFQIEVGSRFDMGEKQFFLNYLLSKVSGVELANDVSFSKGGMWNILLALVFMHKFREACKIGLFKQYIRNEYNDLNYRGHLDLSRHLHNYPICDRIAYSLHEITYDNVINRLIRRALDKINYTWPALLNSDQQVIQNVRLFRQNTSIINNRELKVLLKKREATQSLRHPLYAQYYEPLRIIAIMLLMEDGINLYSSKENSQVEGIVFDGAWLWEEYIATLLHQHGFVHAIGTPGKEQNGIPVFRNRNGKAVKTFYPDFYREGKENGFVLDTKYKFGNIGNREDIQQVMCYMLLANARFGGLVYPPFLEEEEEEEAQNEDSYLSADKRFPPLRIALPNDSEARWWCNYVFTFPNKDVAKSQIEFISGMHDAEERFAKFLDDENERSWPIKDRFVPQD